MPTNPTIITTDQGPSADNQTSNDRSRDPNQAARQPTTKDTIEAEEALRESDVDAPDITSGSID